MRAIPLLTMLVTVLSLVPLHAQQPAPDAVERLLEELANAHGPTGFEGPVREIVRREFQPLADEILTDGLGSLIARLDGNSGGPRIMLAAHMDEVGMIVKRSTPPPTWAYRCSWRFCQAGCCGSRLAFESESGEPSSQRQRNHRAPDQWSVGSS